MAGMAHGNIWFITGASRGLGKALVQQALRAGHRVVAATRDGTAPVEHDRLSVCRLDVRDAPACRRAVRDVVVQHGAIDVLVNNAGYGLVGAIEEIEEKQARAVVDVDLFGALWLTQAVLPAMRERRSGHILQISSVGGVGAMPFFGLYNAAKWGLEGFSEALAGEVREFGIAVTLAEIGAMDTQWATGSMQFSAPIAAYDAVREQVLGTATVPWPSEPEATGGGADPADIAHALVRHVDGSDAGGRLRLLLGSDAPGQVATVLRQRCAEYRRDPGFQATLGTG